MRTGDRVRGGLGWMLLLLASLGPARAQSPAGWKARWIAAPWSTPRDGAEVDGSRPMPIFLTSFTARDKVAHAEFRIAGLGQWSAVLTQPDGTKVLPGGKGLHQAWTDYRKTIPYQSYDLTAVVKPGRSKLTVMLGNGMYNVQRSVLPNGKARYTKFAGSFGAPTLLAELRLTYVDGRTEVVGTNTHWQVARGPVLFSSTYGGEDYDARLEQPANTVEAREVQGPGGALVKAQAPEVMEAAQHSVRAQTTIGTKVVYDLGVNFAGIPHVELHGPAGATLKLTPGELLHADGTVSQGSSGGPAWWSYTLKGGGRETWEPRFSYYGFRYLEAEWTGASSGEVDEVHGVEWHSASASTGSFASSSDLLNGIHALIVNSMHNNQASLFTDCPHREKLGWLEETHLVADAMLFNNDLRGLYRATSRNIADAQHADGGVPTIAPQYTTFGPKYAVYDDSPEWGSAAILAPWAAFRFYGDRQLLARNYATMKRYLGYLEAKAQDGIVAYGLGDWYDIGPGSPGISKNTSLGVTGTLMLYEDAITLQKMALLLHDPAHAARFGRLARHTAQAFERKFWNNEHQWYDNGSQTANAMALALGLVPPEHRAVVLQHVIDDLHAHKDHVTTGEVGLPYLLRALAQAGRDDVILSLLLRTDAPSYGAQLAAGATALTEAWDANPRSSQDHLMLGAGDAWFYRELGGIDLDYSRTDKLVLHPHAPAGLDWVRCAYHSHLGPIESDWHREGGTLTYDITVPTPTLIQIAEAHALTREKTLRPGVFRVRAGHHRFVVVSQS